MASCKNDFLCTLIFVVLKLVRTVSSPWGVGESGWRREKLTFSSCISSASFSVYLFFTVQQSPSLFCTPQAGVMQCFLPQCVGVGSIVWFPDQAAVKETNIAMWKMLFPLTGPIFLFWLTTLCKEISGSLRVTCVGGDPSTRVNFSSYRVNRA